MQYQCQNLVSSNISLTKSLCKLQNYKLHVNVSRSTVWVRCNRDGRVSNFEEFARLKKCVSLSEIDLARRLQKCNAFSKEMLHQCSSILWVLQRISEAVFNCVQQQN